MLLSLWSRHFHFQWPLLTHRWAGYTLCRSDMSEVPCGKSSPAVTS